ncbi:MAG: amylo-alpha-1,6-glucosidase [Bacillaceae bacterium]
MRFGKESLRDYETAISREFLLTNGLGGYVNQTICGSNKRKYSSLLVASLNPPVQRTLLLSQLQETVMMDEKTYPIYTDERIAFKEEGYKYQDNFSFTYYPTFTYNVNGLFIEKRITMVYGKNTTVIQYTLKNNVDHATFTLQPLVNNRDHHDVTKKGDFTINQLVNENGTTITFDHNDVTLYIQSDSAKYEKNEKWYRGMFYANEFERGLDVYDNHLISGVFSVELQPFEEKIVTIIASTEEIKELNGDVYFEMEKERKEKLLQKLSYRDSFTEKLALAADTFITHRQSTDSKTIMAGYPWFTDWGRDTMIAFTGLTLCTGRFEEAKDILYTFSKYVKDGLIPNMFPDDGVDPHYNTIDGSLWYFYAVERYLDYTKDDTFVKEYLFDALQEIITAHIDGTHYGIGMDKDGLMKGGNETTQLTWMDVKIDDWAVTPRQGKAVEICALWYNALCVFSNLCKKFGHDNTQYEQIKKKIEENFVATFWCEETNYFFDYVDGEEKNKQIRPNAIIALSLPHTPIKKEHGIKALGTARKYLYATYGLRSLAWSDEEYEAYYLGDHPTRDSKYHQGTVWGWLIGPYVTALMKYTNDKVQCEMILAQFEDVMRDDCVGNIAEIFDGNAPHTSRGCFAQAWSVSEVLRAYIEDVKK